MATTGGDRVFLDTSVIVAAEVASHPSHDVATALVDRLAARGACACVSPQIWREFLCVLTRGVVDGRTFTVPEAVDALRRSLEGCTTLGEGEETLQGLLELVVRRGVRGKQVHDANVVATMLAHGVGRLATLDETDFRRFEDLVAPEPVAS